MSVYQFEAKDIKGKSKSLSEFEGKALLIVNTASKCGFTPQYEGLEQLYLKYRDQGLEVLAFPCNQFGNQEPGDSNEIQEFCDLNFKTSFPIFDKVEVNGDNAHELFKYLKEKCPGILGSKKIKWNFTKFLVDKNGGPIKRYAPKDTPLSIASDIEKIL